MPSALPRTRASHGLNEVVPNTTPVNSDRDWGGGFLRLLQFGCRFRMTRLQYINDTCATTGSLCGFILPSPASSCCTFAFLVCWHEVHHRSPGTGRIAQCNASQCISAVPSNSDTVHTTRKSSFEIFLKESRCRRGLTLDSPRRSIALIIIGHKQ